jgi:hypothetical protein
MLLRVGRIPFRPWIQNDHLARLELQLKGAVTEPRDFDHAPILEASIRKELSGGYRAACLLTAVA